MSPKRTLRAAQRLKRNNDFIRVRRAGKTFRCRYFALFSVVREADDPANPTTRIGISASRRVGNAIARNALKRRFRAIFQAIQHDIRPGADIVLSLRSPASSAPFAELEQRFHQAIQYNGLLRKRPDRPD